MTTWLAVALVSSAGATALWPPGFAWRVAYLGSTRKARRHPLVHRQLRRRNVDDRVASHERPGARTGTDPPSCAELLAVALSAGCGIHQAVVAVGEDTDAGHGLGAAAAALRRGSPLLDVLDELPRRLGPQWQGMATVLALSASAGTSPIAALQRLAVTERLAQRRRRERQVRRLPVLLLLPLTTMVLPAFVLVTLVPLAIATGATLDLS